MSGTSLSHNLLVNQIATRVMPIHEYDFEFLISSKPSRHLLAQS